MQLEPPDAFVYTVRTIYDWDETAYLIATVFDACLSLGDDKTLETMIIRALPESFEMPLGALMLFV